MKFLKNLDGTISSSISTGEKSLYYNNVQDDIDNILYSDTDEKLVHVPSCQVCNKIRKYPTDIFLFSESPTAVYFFCGAACMGEFLEEPEKYISKKPHMKNIYSLNTGKIFSSIALILVVFYAILR